MSFAETGAMENKECRSAQEPEGTKALGRRGTFRDRYPTGIVRV